jgi:Spy/CpxP family protein refolding chaperone
MDDFDGFKFTDEQKTKIDQIHQTMKSRMDTVSKDERLDAEQKAAMLDGYRRMEYDEVFKALTPEQQLEVRKKVLARRAAEQAEI